MTTDAKPLTRAEQRTKRLAELPGGDRPAQHEKVLEKSIADDMEARGRAAVQLYNLVGINPVRRDDNDEMRAKRLVDEVTKLVETPGRPDDDVEVMK